MLHYRRLVNALQNFLPGGAITVEGLGARGNGILVGVASGTIAEHPWVASTDSRIGVNLNLLSYNSSQNMGTNPAVVENLLPFEA